MFSWSWKIPCALPHEICLQSRAPQNSVLRPFFPSPRWVYRPRNTTIGGSFRLKPFSTPCTEGPWAGIPNAHRLERKKELCMKPNEIRDATSPDQPCCIYLHILHQILPWLRTSVCTWVHRIHVRVITKTVHSQGRVGGSIGGCFLHCTSTFHFHGRVTHACHMLIMLHE